MRFLRIAAIVLAAASVVSFAVLSARSAGKNDPPVLACSVDGMIEVPVLATDEELLGFVSASDKKDGDLSGKIVVTRKNFFDSNKTTIITYAVSDSDNNVAVLNKRLRYTDYNTPRIYLTNDFIFPSKREFNLGMYVRAEDAWGNDLTSQIKLITGEVVTSDGRYTVNIKVSDHMGETTEINVPAIVTSDDYGQLRIRLNEYTTYIKKGEVPDYQAFIKDINNKTNKKYTTADIVVDASEVANDTPGVYNVYYKIFDGKGDDADVISMSRLVVVVEE